MNAFRGVLMAAVLSAALAACNSGKAPGEAPAPAPVSGAPAQLREGFMTDKKGMMLYVFNKDAAGSGKSVCTGACARSWPPFLADAQAHGVGDWSVITRDDGAKQWAYKGKPTYYWSKDRKPGDKFGDNFKDIWHVIVK